MRIYFDALDEAAKLGKDKAEAENYANNELTKAGLRRMDFEARFVEELKEQRRIERYTRMAQGNKD